MSLKNKVLVINMYQGNSYSNTPTPGSISLEIKNVIETETIQDCVESIKDKQYTPAAKDKLYFYPECEVPRFKVREFWKPKNVSIQGESPKSN